VVRGMDVQWGVVYLEIPMMIAARTRIDAAAR
jgi:hypothetical protein